MAGNFFNVGETKKRPGVYQRYEKQRTSVAGAQDGVVAVAFAGNWGGIDKVYPITSPDHGRAVFGRGGNADTIDCAFRGGATKVLAVRIGSGGTTAAAMIADSTDADAVEITAIHPGNRAFKYLLRPVAGDSEQKEFVLIEGGVAIERIRFAAGETGEADALIAAGENSAYFSFKKKAGYAGNGPLKVVAVETAITPGTQPTVTTEQYASAFAMLEPYRFNSICVDTTDITIHALLDAFMARAYESGKTGFSVFGEPISVALKTRQEHAAAFNTYKNVYVGGGWNEADGVLIDGRKAAAVIAGLVASTPSNQAITHKEIDGAISVAEMLSNPQHEACIDSGMLTFSESPSGTVWVESGITTLVNPTGEDDDGWKKIKRTKVRFEVFDRISDTIAPIIGKVSNNENGRDSMRQITKGVLLEMVREEKITGDVAVIDDPDNPAQGDSAWFLISFTDIDSLEKVYLVYKIGGFAPNAR